jgi:hypothetical protein
VSLRESGAKTEVLRTLSGLHMGIVKAPVCNRAGAQRASARNLITGCKPRTARCARTEGSKSVIELTWKPLTPLTGHADGGEQGHA